MHCLMARVVVSAAGGGGVRFRGRLRLRRRHRLGLGGLGRRLCRGRGSGQVLDQGVQQLFRDADHVLGGVLVDHVVEQVLLVAHQGEHLLLVGVRGHHGDDLHRARLAEAVDAGDALFEHGRVPGDVQVDEHRPALQVEPDPAGIGGEEDLHRVVLAEAVDQLAAFGRGHPAVQAHAAQAQARDPGLGHLGHPLPLGEDHRLEPGLQADLAEDVGQLVELGRAHGSPCPPGRRRCRPCAPAAGPRAAGSARSGSAAGGGRSAPGGRPRSWRRRAARAARRVRTTSSRCTIRSGQLLAHQPPVAAQHHRRQPLAQHARGCGSRAPCRDRR